MFEFKLLPPFNFRKEDLPTESYISNNSDIVEAYKEVIRFIWNNGIGEAKAKLIRISHILDKDGNFILLDDVMDEIKKRGLVYGVDYPF